ncbi:hypothetical protein CUMW_229720 [Citrus unshiu]|uniref:Uncharacterized protein n=2 Tax=Citrus TaxID=2706 RepID=A0A067FVE8_CITSI|nr:hypothetical protein CISIN_1g038148mg [Citrus sinensis]GAY63947.1 hypothetical protein CUMW_229720 [Citrus unshiu]
MASSSSSSSKCLHIACKQIYLLFLIVIVLIGSCEAARPGTTMDSVNVKLHKTSFRYKRQRFNFLPKGTPIPPSGPSKRHNSVVDSTQN